MPNTKLIAPYGGQLINLLAPSSQQTPLKQMAKSLPSIQLTAREICDLELLAIGGFSPLTRFMAQADFEHVVHEMRLSDGTLWTIPIILTIHDDAPIEIGMDITLRDHKNRILAIMRVEEKYQYDKLCMAEKVFGTLDTHHPIVAEMNTWGQYAISGELTVLDLPIHYDFTDIRRTPAQTRDILATFLDDGYENVVAFQTRNPMHRVHEELTKRAIDEVNGVLLLHPVVGLT